MLHKSKPSYKNLVTLIRLLVLVLVGHGVALVSATVFAQEVPQPKADALECEQGIIARAAEALHFAGGAELWSEGMTAHCRLDPDHPRQAIVALTYIRGEEVSGKPDTGGNAYERDLDLVIMDIEHDKIIAHAHEDSAIDDGGERFEGISIDTGRYILAPGRRAFGVRTMNTTHCWCANSSRETLRLYLQNGRRLDWILGTNTYEYQAGLERGAEPTSPCEAKDTVSKTVVKLVAGRSHGLSDIQFVTTKTLSYSDDEHSKCPALSPVKEVATFHFDGQVYKN